MNTENIWKYLPPKTTPIYCSDNDKTIKHNCPHVDKIIHLRKHGKHPKLKNLQNGFIRCPLCRTCCIIGDSESREIKKFFIINKKKNEFFY